MKRTVFISASCLVKIFDEVPQEEMKDSIFFFGSKRSWVFPSNSSEVVESKKQPTDYLSFPDSFRSLILEKESRGLVCWLKPACDFRLVSRFFENLGYSPLKLDRDFWRTRRIGDSKYRVNGERVFENLVMGEHDYSSVQELIWQSDHRLEPKLFGN